MVLHVFLVLEAQRAPGQQLGGSHLACRTVAHLCRAETQSGHPYTVRVLGLVSLLPLRCDHLQPFLRGLRERGARAILGAIHVGYVMAAFTALVCASFPFKFL